MMGNNSHIPAAELLAMLASAMESGLILCCGESLEPYCRKISVAMPMTTRLVLNVESESGLKQSQSLSALDIRIAVHKQESLEFLEDINRYLFNLVLLENNDNTAKIIAHIQKMLMPDAIIAVINGDIGRIQASLPTAAWHIVDTGWPDKTILVRERSQNAQPTQRKGGRRARISR